MHTVCSVEMTIGEHACSALRERYAYNVIGEFGDAAQLLVKWRQQL